MGRGGGGGGRGATENLNLLCGSEKLACDVYSKFRVCVTGYRDVFDLPVINFFALAFRAILENKYTLRNSGINP